MRALLTQFREVPGLADVEIQAFRRADQVLLIVSRAIGKGNAESDGAASLEEGLDATWTDDLLSEAVREDLESIGARMLFTREGNDRLQCMVKLGR